MERGALAEYADYCRIPDYRQEPQKWLRTNGVEAYDQHQVSIVYPDGQTRYRETTGRKSHRWKQGSRTGRSVYWPARRTPGMGRLEGGVWDRVLLVEGESSTLALSAFLDDTEGTAGGGTFVAGSPGSSWPNEGRWTACVASAAKKTGSPVYCWPDTEPDGRPDAGGKGWSTSVRRWADKHRLEVLEVGPYGQDGRDWITTGAGPSAADLERLWENTRELPVVRLQPRSVPDARPAVEADRRWKKTSGCDNTFSPQEVSVMFSDRVDEWLQEKGATRKPGGWSCGGPGHKRGDRRPSLSVFTTPDGVRGYKCYVAGCWSGNAWSLLMERLGSTQDVFAEAHRLRGCCQPD